MSSSTISNTNNNIISNNSKAETIRRMREARERRKQAKAAACIQAPIRGAMQRSKYQAFLQQQSRHHRHCQQVKALQAQIQSLQHKLATADTEREMAVKEAEDRVLRAVAAMNDEIIINDDDDDDDEIDELLRSFSTRRHKCDDDDDDVNDNENDTALNTIAKQTKLEESARAMEFLQHEQERLQNQLEAHKARCERLTEQIKTIQETNQLYLDKFKELDEYNAILQENKLTLARNKEIYASQLKAYRKELKKGQAYQKSEEDIRNLYQDAVERIVALVQEECKDDDLVEEIYLLALECGEGDDEKEAEKASDLTETEISEESTSENV